jgi:hypothetical protein
MLVDPVPDDYNFFRLHNFLVILQGLWVAVRLRKDQKRQPHK